MTLFYGAAAILVIVALAVLLPSLLRSPANDAPDADAGAPPGTSPSADQRATNIAIAREQRAALDEARDNGQIDEANYAQERERLERQLAAELDAPGRQRGGRGAGIAAAALVVIGVPLAATLLYMDIGTPQAIGAGDRALAADRSPGAAQGGAPGPATGAATGTPEGAGPGAPGEAGTDQPDIEALLAQLQGKLAENPGDAQGWRLLGRTWLSLERFDQAATALGRAVELEPDEVDTLTQLAEARAMVDGGDLGGAALPLLERANRLAPDHEQTLWLLGIARQQAGEHAAAIELLERLRGIATENGNAEAVTTIDQYLGISREALGQPAPPAQAPGAASDPVAEAAENGMALTLDVSLSDEAEAAVSPDQAVFVFARASDGSPIPLAVQRVTVADLPITIRLDESMAMMPNMTISSVPQLVVGARVSSDGQPAAKSGEWYAEVDGVSAVRADAGGTPIGLRIDEQVP